MPAFCEWCVKMGNQQTLPMGMCHLHRHAPDMLMVLSLIHGWYKLGGRSLSPSALIGPDNKTVMQMLEDVLRKANGT